MSQSDYLSGISARRPDSDVAPDLYRNYEVAGSAHATPDELNFAAASADIEKGGRAVPPMDCNEGPRSRFPNWPAFNAILRNLDNWVRTGTPAPRAEPILVDDGKPVLDRFGNVVGGIRSPFVEAPTSTWFGNSTGPSFCRIAGHDLGGALVHADRRSHDAASDVGAATQLECSLHASVLAVGPMQNRHEGIHRNRAAARLQHARDATGSTRQRRRRVDWHQA